MQGFISLVDSLLGLDKQPQELAFQHIALRGVIVFIMAVVMVRLGDKRFLSRKTAFDAILGFVLASTLARAINGSAAFWPTLAGGFVLVGLHRLMAFTSRHWHALGHVVKGRSEVLICDGQLRHETMLRNDLTPHDLEEGLRLHGVERVEDVRLAYVERNGDISVVKK